MKTEEVTSEGETVAKLTLRQRVVAMAKTPHALAALAVVSVIDGSVFPVPPFALLIPMVLANPKRAFRYSLIGTVASLFGGYIGYGLGFLISRGLTSAFSIDPNLPIHFHALGLSLDSTLAHVLGDNFWLLILACSILPTPYKIVAVGSGLVGVPLPAFFLASLIGRTARFFIIAYVLVFFGKRAEKFFSPKAAGVIALFILFAARPAYAHVPPGTFIVAKMAEKRASLNLTDLDLSLSSDKDGEASTERLYLKRGGKLRWVRNEDGGESVTIVDAGRRAETDAQGHTTVENIAADPLVDFLLPRTQSSESVRAEFIGVCQRLNIDLSVNTMGRQGGRLAYVYGAKPSDKDKPQIWIDKDSMQPLRVIYAGTHGGKTGIWDLRLMEWNSREAGDAAPHFIERWFDGVLVSKSEVEKAATNVRLAESLFQLPRS